ncbi:MAG: serine/threonine-protein phosphatase [Acidobacteriaceae bacterium]|nr:serine/threonine-protein phosphatase [Acidobacteriaceae bacterium]MBV9778543.1 serine/threonine-protein phosphatase [Acidobacteriaceae bacterium]
MRASNFQTAVLSEPGGREANEDSCLWDEVGESACWVVADGLGGHNGGELASKTATSAIIASFKHNPEVSNAALDQHFIAAHNAMLACQKENPALADMRSTAVALLSDSRNALWGHVGDSRLYWFKPRGLVMQTEDHSVPQALVKAGDLSPDRIRGHTDRNRLLRSLGQPGAVHPAILESPQALFSVDAFLLCTDGFWESVLETEMLADLVASASPQEWLKRSESRLMARALSRGDNYSAIAIFVSPTTAESAHLAAQPLQGTA